MKTTKIGLIKKFKKQSKPLRRILLLIGLIYLVSLVFFSKALLLLAGIETPLRITILIVLALFLFIYLLSSVLLLFTHKKKSLIVLYIVFILISSILGVGSYYIEKTYGIIENVQKAQVTYKSVMISLVDKSAYEKVGMISSKEDPTGYIIPKDMIKKYNITGEIVEYDDYISMMSDLYDGVIDALFIADNYVTMFNNYEKFQNIHDETKVIYEMEKELDNIDKVSYTSKDLTEPFTILLMGVDATGDGLSKGASFNGDTLMLISFNPKTLSSTVFSIPRDTYVPIACRNNQEAKINSSAYGGTSCVVKTIENLTSIKIDYYVKINFTGVVKLVDDLGQIEVDVPVSICEQDSQRRFGEHEICLEKGLQKLNGEQALALSRHRHSLPLGDFQRVQHQQLVVEGMLNSLKKVKDVDTFYKILSDVTNNIDTNMTTPQILSLYKTAKKVLLDKDSTAKLSIQRTYLTGYDLTMYLPSTKSYAYTFQYYRQSLDDIVNAMKINLEITKPELIKTFSYNPNEPYEQSIAGKTYYKEDRRELLPNFIGQTKSYIESWANERNINISFVEVSESDPLYNGGIDGTIVSQKEHVGQLVEGIKTLELYVIKRTNGQTDNNTTVEPKEQENTTPEKQAEETEEKLPNFYGKSLDEFNKWKNNLTGVSIVFDVKELSVEDALGIDDELSNNHVYKQSVDAGTPLKDVTSLIVYVYKESN